MYKLVGSRAKRFLFKENFPVFKQSLSAGFFLMIFIKHYFSTLFIILEGFLHESFILKDHMTRIKPFFQLLQNPVASSLKFCI